MNAGETNLSKQNYKRKASQGKWEAYIFLLFILL